MKKFITMVLVMLVMSMMIPVCAWAQTYEEALSNQIIMDELVDEGFAYDKDSNLWIYKKEDADDEERVLLYAEYNIVTNEGKMNIEHGYYEDGDLYPSESYEITFKWYSEEEEFNIVTANIVTYRSVSDLLLF